MQIDIFDPGDAEDGHHQVTQLLLVGLVLLGSEVEWFAAVLGEVGTGYLPYLFGEGKQEDRAVFIGVSFAPVDPTQVIEVFGEWRFKVSVFGFGHASIILWL